MCPYANKSIQIHRNNIEDNLNIELFRNSIFHFLIFISRGVLKKKLKKTAIEIILTITLIIKGP